MKVRAFAWYLAPGFTIIQARNAFCDHGKDALQVYGDEISVRPRKGWKRVLLQVSGHRMRTYAAEYRPAKVVK